jgi:methionyl-tRNA synthetase
MSNYYVTTSIPYVNGQPHIGFAWELLIADVLARAARTAGKTTIFSTGTDEHGTKVAQKAAELKLTPKQFADQVSASFHDLTTLVGATPDRFVRTTDKGHEQRAQLIWKALEKDIYKAKYVGWYDVRQEEFVPEAQADPERMKPDHPQAYQKLEEENYFFRLSNYNEQILKAIESNQF